MIHGPPKIWTGSKEEYENDLDNQDNGGGTGGGFYDENDYDDNMSMYSDESNTRSVRSLRSNGASIRSNIYVYVYINVC